jgi:8-oxo-dGTP pyrophosphatase MutT (NUDIX family)
LNIKLNYYELETPHVAIANDYAAVSILIFDKKEILYIKRSNEMPTHKGQIAFPGGKKEEKDIDIVSTAVRESTEELLLNESTIKPFGYLNSIDTVEYKFDVYPVVCHLFEKPKNFNVSEVQKFFLLKSRSYQIQIIGVIEEPILMIGFL